MLKHETWLRHYGSDKEKLRNIDERPNLCRICDKPIRIAELCEDCAKGHDPFFSCDNSGSDLKR